MTISLLSSNKLAFTNCFQLRRTPMFCSVTRCNKLFPWLNAWLNETYNWIFLKRFFLLHFCSNRNYNNKKKNNGSLVLQTISIAGTLLHRHIDVKLRVAENKNNDCKICSHLDGTDVWYCINFILFIFLLMCLNLGLK